MVLSNCNTAQACLSDWTPLAKGAGLKLLTGAPFAFVSGYVGHFKDSYRLPSDAGPWHGLSARLSYRYKGVTFGLTEAPVLATTSSYPCKSSKVATDVPLTSASGMPFCYTDNGQSAEGHLVDSGVLIGVVPTSVVSQQWMTQVVSGLA